jgi:DNA (cytosine-5)-methyltransferase 1
MAKHSLKSISLFSGAGGFDIGIKNSGFEVLACVEIDEHACATLRENIYRQKEKTKVIQADITTISPTTFLKEMNLKRGEIDLLFGGPPCQSFSQIGKQLYLKDARGLLLFEIIRFAKVLLPKVILVEQVKGLLTAKGENNIKGEVFEDFINQIKKLGYTANWKIINSAHFGVAQKRERVFIVATKGDYVFNFPSATHNSNFDQILPLLPIQTVGKVISDLQKPAMKGSLVSSPIHNHIDVTPAGDRKRIVGVPEGQHLAAQKHLPPEQIGKLSKKDTTKYLRLSRSGISNTLRCGEIFFHPIEHRYLTPREYMRIHGYPDDYVLIGPVRGRSGRVRNLDQHRQVSNSVPPPVAEKLGREIERIITCQRSLRSSDTKLVTRATKQNLIEKLAAVPL